MKPEQILDYEIALLLAKYGDKRVVATLAHNLGLSTESLERKFSELKNVKPRASARKPVDISRMMDSIVAENPEKASHLRLLLARFQNKTFLAELKDVRRFFERRGQIPSAIKSRAETAPRLFKLLATLDAAELAGLCETDEQKDHSSLGIISDEIMRRGR